MNKKFRMVCILALVVLLVVPMTLSASNFLGLKVGPTAKLAQTFTLETLETTDLSEFSVNDLCFGVDARLNVSVLEVAANAEFIGMISDIFETSEPGVILSTFLSGGLSINLLGLLDVAVTAGPMVYIAAGPNFGVELMFDDINSAPLMIRTSADLSLGGISVGGFVLVDPKVSIGEIMAPDFVYNPATEPTAQVGVSVLFNLL